jgi:hypothetical protein
MPWCVKCSSDLLGSYIQNCVNHHIPTVTRKTTGGGSNAKNIQGQIYSGKNDIGDSAVSGSVTVGYNSCNIKNALSSQPLKVVNWKNSF